MKTFYLALAAGVLSTVSPAHADEDIDWKKGKLGALSETIGTYHWERVVADPVVSGKIIAAVGAKQFETLKKNLSVSGPIAFDGMRLVMHGNAPHSGMSDCAVLTVSLYDGKIAFGIFEDGKKIVTGGDDMKNDASSNGAVTQDVTRWKNIMAGRP